MGKITLKVGGSDETRWCVGGYWSVCVCTCVCPFQQGGEEGEERREVRVCSHLAAGKERKRRGGRLTQRRERRRGREEVE